MKAFEVYINGQKRCTAGIGELGCLTAILHWVKREQEVLRKRKNLEDEELALRVGGSFTAPDGADESVEWIGEALAVGDEITIKIVDAEHITPPTAKRRRDPDTDAKAERRYYEQLKKQYGE